MTSVEELERLEKEMHKVSLFTKAVDPDQFFRAVDLGILSKLRILLIFSQMRVKFLKTLDFDLQPELILIGTYENSIMSSFIDSKIYGNIANVATMYYFITFHCTVRQSVLLSQAGMKIRNFFPRIRLSCRKKICVRLRP